MVNTVRKQVKRKQVKRKPSSKLVKRKFGNEKKPKPQSFYEDPYFYLIAIPAVAYGIYSYVKETRRETAIRNQPTTIVDNTGQVFNPVDWSKKQEDKRITKRLHQRAGQLNKARKQKELIAEQQKFAELRQRQMEMGSPEWVESGSSGNSPSGKTSPIITMIKNVKRRLFPGSPSPESASEGYDYDYSSPVSKRNIIEHEPNIRVTTMRTFSSDNITRPLSPIVEEMDTFSSSSSSSPETRVNFFMRSPKPKEPVGKSVCRELFNIATVMERGWDDWELEIGPHWYYLENVIFNGVMPDGIMRDELRDILDIVDSNKVSVKNERGYERVKDQIFGLINIFVLNYGEYIGCKQAGLNSAMFRKIQKDLMGNISGSSSGDGDGDGDGSDYDPDWGIL